MPDIDKMTSDEWIKYRLDLVDAHLAKGLPLVPDPKCSVCDVDNLEVFAILLAGEYCPWILYLCSYS